MYTDRFLKSALLLACTVLLAGCDGEDISGVGDLADVRPYVTGAAAAALGANGQFSLPAPVAPTEREIITPERAQLLASSYVLTFGPLLRTYWNQESGRSIVLSSLKPEARVFYGSTPYGAFPAGFHPAFSTAFGPYYVVRMRSGGNPVLQIAVAAYATEVGIDGDGKIQRPTRGGSEFVSQGIPTDSTRADLPTFASPEEAVVRVGRLTGARVSDVPELLRAGFPLGPFSSLWRVTLDREVRVKTAQSGRTLATRELYVGSEPGRRLMVPASSQPTELVTDALRVDSDGEGIGVEQVRVPVRPAPPLIFEEVVLQP